MSSKAVRDKFRASWPILVPSIPMFDVVNDDPDHDIMPDLWVAVEFISFNEEAVSLGRPACRRESGTITIVLSVKSGTSDDAINDAAEVIRDAYRYWKDGSVRSTQIDPPVPADGFSDGLWYIVDIDISYDYDRFI